jgi:phosphoribosylanthranilate isomerase
MWIKICANTCVEDALAAVACGADALGFVLAESRRQVDAAQVRAITSQLPASVESVGVFASSNADAIAQAVEQSGVHTAQLHGGLNLPLATELRQRLGSDFSIIQTTHWMVGDEAASAQRITATIESLAATGDSPRLLVDAKLGAASGGLGVSFNWQSAQPAFARADELGVRLILAGGLRPDNVIEAIRTLHPWGIDVASGVERAPGHKDRALIQSFVAAARLASSRFTPAIR